jgi:hypothetical protein
MIHAKQIPFRPPIRSLSEMDRNQIVRETIDEIENRLCAMSVNKTYQMAFKVVFRVMREMKR